MVMASVLLASRTEPCWGERLCEARGRCPLEEMMKLTAGMMKRCSQILTKLMKHAGAVWFRAPVDVVALKLYDHHHIIKNPMDLGTARSRLSKGLYPSPVDFAADIRASGGEDGVVRVWKVIECERRVEGDALEYEASCIYFTVNHNSELAPLCAANKEKVEEYEENS